MLTDFLKRAYLLSKEFIALRKLIVVTSTFLYAGSNDRTNLYQSSPR